MTRNPRVLTGQHFLLGDRACAEGALAAGCEFFAGYPITPSTEIAERLARRLPEVRSEEHTSELQSHSFISYAVFCLKKTNEHTS